jgi:hypothetical protein
VRKVSIDLSKLARESKQTAEMVRELEGGGRTSARFLGPGTKAAPKWRVRFLSCPPKVAPKRD